MSFHFWIYIHYFDIVLLVYKVYYVFFYMINGDFTQIYYYLLPSLFSEYYIINNYLWQVLITFIDVIFIMVIAIECT